LSNSHPNSDPGGKGIAVKISDLHSALDYLGTKKDRLVETDAEVDPAKWVFELFKKRGAQGGRRLDSSAVGCLTPRRG
jgi:hypothetical protein